MALRVPVPLAGRPYEVRIGDGLLTEIGEILLDEYRGRKCAIVTDSNVGPLYAGRVEKSLRDAGFECETITVPAGENSKGMVQAAEICERLVALGLDRGSFLLALGGGVVGDLAGFVAAIYFRGIPYVQLPTTLLAQVDSSVGGKTGVNAAAGKNLIGAFHQPQLVLADVSTLRTLPERELNEGFGEIIKHGIIRDRELLDTLERSDMASLVARNVRIKAAIVAADEHELSGERALLNFGHTVGHAIENAAGYGRYLHGEAISLGIVVACDLSVKCAGLSSGERDFVLEKLAEFKLPIHLPADLASDSILAVMLKDKKFSRGKIRFVLTPRLGEAFLADDVTADDIRDSIELTRAPAAH